MRNVEQALTHISKFPVAGAVDTIELRWSGPLLQAADRINLGDFVQAVADCVLASGVGSPVLFFEVPAVDVPWTPTGWREALDASAAALARHNQNRSPGQCSAGMKFRTGGASASAVPATWQLAAAIDACRSAEIFWKATAGLHHPLRHYDPALGAPAHGFLNLLAAAVLAQAHRLGSDQIRAILEEDAAAGFHFGADEFSWRDLSLATREITAAREHSMRSFGSCSFDEPRQHLHHLGLL
jgi:hypothetical protein